MASIAKYPVTKIDCVEIIPEVLDAAHFFSDWNENVLADPRLNMVIDDGRSFLFGTDEKYDVISCDPIHPAFGSPALYTKEYFAECYQKLTDSGVAVQYLPFHQLSLYDLSVLVNTFRSVFPHTSIWLASYHGIIVGQKNLTDLDLGALTQRMDMPRIKSDLAKSNISGIDDLLGRMILGETQVNKLVSGISDVNTDNHTIIEYAHSRFFGKNTWIENMTKILEQMGSRPYHELFQSKNIDSMMDARLAKVYRFRQHAIQARLYSEKKMPDQAFQELIRLLELEPADPETLFLSGAAMRQRFLQISIQLLKKGQDKSAVKTLEKAIALGLGSSELFTNLGGLHVAMGDTKKAINMLEKAIEIQPEYPPALNILAKIKNESK